MSTLCTHSFGTVWKMLVCLTDVLLCTSVMSPSPFQLNQFVEAQRRSSEWMQEQLLEESRSHARALHRLEEQERRLPYRSAAGGQREVGAPKPSRFGRTSKQRG